MKNEAILKHELVGAMDEFECNVPKAAKELGVTRSGIYWLLNKYGKKIVKTKKLIDVKENT